MPKKESDEKWTSNGYLLFNADGTPEIIAK